jgi:hypothetical protein
VFSAVFPTLSRVVPPTHGRWRGRERLAASCDVSGDASRGCTLPLAFDSLVQTRWPPWRVARDLESARWGKAATPALFTTKSANCCLGHSVMVARSQSGRRGHNAHIFHRDRNGSWFVGGLGGLGTVHVLRRGGQLAKDRPSDLHGDQIKVPPSGRYGKWGCLGGSRDAPRPRLLHSHDGNGRGTGRARLSRNSAM